MLDRQLCFLLHLNYSNQTQLSRYDNKQEPSISVQEFARFFGKVKLSQTEYQLHITVTDHQMAAIDGESIHT